MLCRVCGNLSKPRRYGGTTFLVCESCGYGSLPASDGRDDYWEDPSEAERHEYWIAAKQSYFTAALEELGSRARGRRLLDLGGGVGAFAAIALEHGWDAYSVDLSPAATALAQETVGRERAFSSLSQFPDDSFDVVTMWCVVAHTRDPLELVTSAGRLLRPGGVIWITTPNFGFQKGYSNVRRLLRRPLDFATEDHVGHFAPRSIRALLERCDFEDTRFHSCGITEVCLAASSKNRGLVSLKRSYNRATYTLARIGGPNLMSELQVSAVFRG